MDEIITFEEQGFAGCLGQSVRKAIAKIKFCRVSTSLTEIAIGLTGEAGLRFRLLQAATVADRLCRFGNIDHDGSGYPNDLGRVLALIKRELR